MKKNEYPLDFWRAMKEVMNGEVVSCDFLEWYRYYFNNGDIVGYSTLSSNNALTPLLLTSNYLNANWRIVKDEEIHFKFR